MSYFLFFFTYNHTYIKCTLTEKHTPTTEAYQNTREPKKERSPPKSNEHYKKRQPHGALATKTGIYTLRKNNKF